MYDSMFSELHLGGCRVNSSALNNNRAASEEEKLGLREAIDDMRL